eukprot:CAMPEP_0198646388 /NCGR_PEP_ID=MMETSP1467-20131203/1865_1 /TAXON_ID=1462469 /ORGANISM="unid. sp., Strain CCMP2135" /LENGTH=124 /DNA_ID=CAMNT_0044381923 /DNA_START=284 /DNA_END=655 /DNA_ORIENTATION=-
MITTTIVVVVVRATPCKLARRFLRGEFLEFVLCEVVADASERGIEERDRQRRRFLGEFGAAAVRILLALLPRVHDDRATALELDALRREARRDAHPVAVPEPLHGRRVTHAHTKPRQRRRRRHE